MIKIDGWGRVIFEKTTHRGRKVTGIIETTKDDEYNDSPSINIAATGSILVEDIPQFIKAIKIAARIATGELRPTDRLNF